MKAQRELEQLLNKSKKKGKEENKNHPTNKGISSLNQSKMNKNSINKNNLPDISIKTQPKPNLRSSSQQASKEDNDEDLLLV